MPPGPQSALRERSWSTCRNMCPEEHRSRSKQEFTVQRGGPTCHEPETGPASGAEPLAIVANPAAARGGALALLRHPRLAHALSCMYRPALGAVALAICVAVHDHPGLRKRPAHPRALTHAHAHRHHLECVRDREGPAQGLMERRHRLTRLRATPCAHKCVPERASARLARRELNVFNTFLGGH